MLLGELLQPNAGPKESSASSASSATPDPAGAPIHWSPFRGQPRGPGGLPGAGTVSVSVPSAGGSGVPRRAGCADPLGSLPAGLRGAERRQRGPGSGAAGGEQDMSFFPVHPRRQSGYHHKCEVIPQRNFK